MKIVDSNLVFTLYAAGAEDAIRVAETTVSAMTSEAIMTAIDQWLIAD